VTVLIAIQCPEGIVVAADGAATFVMGQLQTAKQPVKKLSIVDGTAVFGHSGMVGVGQRLLHVFQDAWGAKQIGKKKDFAQLASELRNRFWQEVMQGEVAVIDNAGKTMGHLARAQAEQSFLIAVPPLKGEAQPSLVHFDWKCTPERLNTSLPTVALGSGQAIADPFLSYIRHVFWNDKVPATLADAMFVAKWTLHYVIATNPGGVSAPDQYAVIRQGPGAVWQAIELSEVELQEHTENVEALEEHMRDYARKFRPA
jgi:hypothetical protein